MDWRNTRYNTDCQGLAPTPFAVDVHDGKGQGPGRGAYSKGYNIIVQAVATGDLTGDGKPEAAVLLSCAPQPSNFYVQDVQAFTDGPNQPQLLGKLPEQSPLPNGIGLSPLFSSNPFVIRSGQLVTGVDYYSSTDSHASGPSIHRDLTWQWDGGRFTATNGEAAAKSADEEAAVAGAVKGHYDAIGARDFEKAYSYFGPTFRSENGKQDWIDKEKSYRIKGTTIHSVKVNNVSGDQANATVDVTSQDNTGNPRFQLTWNLIKEDGQWKLDEQASGEKVG